MLNLYCVDDGRDLRRGKVSMALLPQEQMMERFTENVRHKMKSWKTTKRRGLLGRVKIVSVCTWQGVTCNERSEISSVNWDLLNIGGKLNFEFLPKL